ncbi:MAG: hypothetical protein JWN38_947 [Candidatus Saccharibacteria bacterium]|nr:hypothetical protein [Candidatus Saccharibacteria bacterium]
MKLNRLLALLQNGDTEKYTAGQVFYALDFKEELYIVQSGYVKRYSVNEDNIKVIESIYGPGYFFPLSTVYKKLLNFDLSQESSTYVYQAMTDLEIQGVSSDKLKVAVDKDPGLYADLFFEAGRRLEANINRLASNALRSDYKKVAHQLVYLGEEFGQVGHRNVKTGLKILVPLEPVDMAEQLNIDIDTVDSIMAKLEQQKLIVSKQNTIYIPDMDLLKDAYLRG